MSCLKLNAPNVATQIAVDMPKQWRLVTYLRIAVRQAGLKVFTDSARFLCPFTHKMLLTYTPALTLTAGLNAQDPSSSLIHKNALVALCVFRHVRWMPLLGPLNKCMWFLLNGVQVAIYVFRPAQSTVLA
jgi:hypothetical protein